MGTMQGLEGTFDTVASTYEKLQPGYCDELYKMIFGYCTVNQSSNVVAKFEELDFEDNEFDLVYSASAFHWIPEGIGYTKVLFYVKGKWCFCTFCKSSI